MDETGWLIESASPQGVPQYWDGRRDNSFTIDANEAVRFARFEDAERVRAWMLLYSIRNHCRSVLHGWAPAPPPEQKEGDTRVEGQPKSDSRPTARGTHAESEGR